MKVSKSTPKHERWIVYTVLFHSQQCTEKALKAYLVYRKVKLKRTHDLVDLVNKYAEINDEFQGLKDKAHKLS